MLRRHGPETLKPLGEIEFASGIAAMFASGHYANALGCEAIIGGLSLLAGDAMQPAIESALALSGGRLRGMRNPLAGIRIRGSRPARLHHRQDWP